MIKAPKVTKKLVIEITDTDGRTQLLKRRNGIGKFLDNIDSMFKRDRIIRAIDGVKMFFVNEDGGELAIPEGSDLEPFVVEINPEIKIEDDEYRAGPPA